MLAFWIQLSLQNKICIGDVSLEPKCNGGSVVDQLDVRFLDQDQSIDELVLLKTKRSIRISMSVFSKNCSISVVGFDKELYIVANSYLKNEYPYIRFLNDYPVTISGVLPIDYSYFTGLTTQPKIKHTRFLIEKDTKIIRANSTKYVFNNGLLKNYEVIIEEPSFYISNSSNINIIDETNETTSASFEVCSDSHTKIKSDLDIEDLIINEGSYVEIADSTKFTSYSTIHISMNYFTKTFVNISTKLNEVVPMFVINVNKGNAAIIPRYPITCIHANDSPQISLKSPFNARLLKNMTTQYENNILYLICDYEMVNETNIQKKADIYFINTSKNIDIDSRQLSNSMYVTGGGTINVNSVSGTFPPITTNNAEVVLHGHYVYSTNPINIGNVSFSLSKIRVQCPEFVTLDINVEGCKAVFNDTNRQRNVFTFDGLPNISIYSDIVNIHSDNHSTISVLEVYGGRVFLENVDIDALVVLSNGYVCVGKNVSINTINMELFPGEVQLIDFDFQIAPYKFNIWFDRVSAADDPEPLEAPILRGCHGLLSKPADIITEYDGKLYNATFYLTNTSLVVSYSPQKPKQYTTRNVCISPENINLCPDGYRVLNSLVGVKGVKNLAISTGIYAQYENLEFPLTITGLEGTPSTKFKGIWLSVDAHSTARGTHLSKR